MSRSCERIALFAETMDNPSWPAPGTGTPLKESAPLAAILDQYGIKPTRTVFGPDIPD